MNTQIVRALALLSGIAVLSAGCGGVVPDGQPAAAPVDVRELVASTRSWNGALLPGYPPGQPEITVLRITVPAGARLETHHHPVINAGVLLSGRLTVVSGDGNTLELKAGEAIVELVGTPHYGVNPGRVPAELVVFYAGVPGTPITVRTAH